MYKRGLTLPSFLFPIAAFLLWFHLVLSYIPILELGLKFPVQILLADFFFCNLILVLTWFLCPRSVFYVFAGTTLIIVGYLTLDLGKTGLLVQALTVVLIYIWLYILTRQVGREKLQQIVAHEKIRGRLNLATRTLRDKEHLIVALRKKLERLNYLREFSDRLKEISNSHKTAQIITREISSLMPHADQALVYVIDEKTHELGLVAHSNRGKDVTAKNKKGDEFDHWVLRRSQPLLIEDVKNDFRFSYDDSEPVKFSSIAIAPLVSEQKVFGILRINAVKPKKFHADDLRFLDIAADLSSVSLKNVLLFEKTKELAVIDSLTECYLLRHVQERLGEEIRRAARSKFSFSVIMADIDYFKKYNDQFGHAAGDIVLKGIAEILRNTAGPLDIVGRYGGEEFVIIAAQKDGAEGYKLAEEIRKNVESKEFVLRKQKQKITISLGVAVFPDHGATKEELLWNADMNLYKAKGRGRNRTVLEKK